MAIIELLGEMAGFLVLARVELFLFVVAVGAYLVLFGNVLPKGPKKMELKAEDSGEAARRRTARTVTSTAEVPIPDPEEFESLQKSFQQAFDKGDHRTTLRCWNQMKRSDRTPEVNLAHVVESMQRFKKDAAFVVRELRAFFKKYPSECEIPVVNDLLENLAKRLDTELMEKIVEMLPGLDLKADQRTYEVFLNMHFTLRNFSEVRSLAVEMKRRKVPLTTRSQMVMIKTALKTGSLEEAVAHFKDLKGLWSETSALASPSAAPTQIVAQVVELACKEHQLTILLPELKDVPLTTEVLNVMLLEGVRRRDSQLTNAVEQLARDQGVEFSDTSYQMLIRAWSGADSEKVKALFDEMLEKKMVITAELGVAVIAFCGQKGDLEMAELLYSKMKPTQTNVLAALMKLFSEHDRPDRTCEIYEKDIKAQQKDAEAEGAAGAAAGAKNQDKGGSAGAAPQFLDARMERTLMNAALKCGRTELAKTLLSSSSLADSSKHVATIRSCVAENNLPGAMAVFDSLQQAGHEATSVLYNTVLDACVECHDLEAAEKWMARTKEAGMADVVSYNTMVKAQLKGGSFQKARGVVDQMKEAGVTPNRVTFNELLNSLCVSNQGPTGSAAPRPHQGERWSPEAKSNPNKGGQIWELVQEMTEAGVKPNHVTCSILLKSLNVNSGQAEVLSTMELLNTMDEPMDEVLLSSVVEACVRIGKPDLLTAKLKQLQGNDTVAVTGAHTFGSLIKAYGHAKDINGVWRCWKEMRSRHIRPTSITLGCMVEAVVSNGDTEGAYDLIHQMQDDEQCRDVLNAVIYCSVLKGFTREKKLDRVWTVYEEMKTRKVDLSIVTCNTLIDACARCSRMDRVSTVVEDMKAQSIEPTVITYSTILKGHCMAGDMQAGFGILEKMKAEGKLKPDEIMYNSLLDGCAQASLVEDAKKLLDEMQASGVKPSNFTLSVLVKLYNRAKKLDEAFAVVEQITKKYRFKPNVHVYGNLIQACVFNKQLPRAMTVLDQMVKEKVNPDSRTYAIIIRGCVSSGALDQACGIIRAALGLPGAVHFLAHAQSVAQCAQLDPAMVNELLTKLVEKDQAGALAAPLLEDLKQYRPKVRIDNLVQRKVMQGTMGGVISQDFGNNGGPQQQQTGAGGASGFGAPQRRQQARGQAPRQQSGKFGANAQQPPRI